jgi:phosphatidylglycerol:prolipoprotein diacylglycerol transferase
MQSTAYGWLMLAGIFAGIIFWARLAKRDSRLMLIYIAALAGAFLGAKLVYLGAEGWLHWHDKDRWLQLVTGKSILGGLLGGYAAVEIAKRLLGYSQVTGDWFAIIVPVGIILGRIGCWSHGCCLGIECAPAWFTLNDSRGVSRWPSVQMEIVFNLCALLMFAILRHRRLCIGQHFHLYLMGYGAFRFMHEFLRLDPKVFGPLSGYHFAAIGVFLAGLCQFVRRRRQYQAAFETQAPAMGAHSELIGS